MPEVNVSELRSHLPDYLSRAETGEEILITRRGHIVACLTPFTGNRKRAKRRLAELRAKANVGDVVSPIDADWEAER